MSGSVAVNSTAYRRRAKLRNACSAGLARGQRTHDEHSLTLSAHEWIVLDPKSSGFALGGVSEVIARDHTLSPLEPAATMPEPGEDEPIIVGGAARWIEIELPFPFSVKSEEEGVYSIYKAEGRPRLSKIVITDSNDQELFSWPIAGDWKVKFV